MAGFLLPFTFTELPSSASSKRKQAVTLQLITKLTSTSFPPATHTAVDYLVAEETMPSWVVKLAEVKRSAFTWKVMEKEIYRSDISDQQNRFMIRSQVFAERMMPMMTGEEIEAANLTVTFEDNIAKKRRRLYNGGGGEAGERRQGREHGGLEVKVYNSDGWGCWLSLTRWDASKASVLKGRNYKEFRRRCFFATGDTVEMWAFRGSEDGQLFLAIGNKINLDISL